MVAKVRFWLSESSSSIAKAMIIILVMILKSSFLYAFFFTKRPFYTRKATLPLWPVERSFLIVS